jgi:filamentous hemagglutinin
VKDTAAGSSVGSLYGNVALLAGGDISVQGSTVAAQAGDVTLRGRSILITEAQTRTSDELDTQFRQSGLTVSLGGTLINTVNTLQQAYSNAKATDDPRMKALAGMSAALAVVDAVNAVRKGNQPIDNGDGTTTDPNAADKLGGVSLNVSLGASRSNSTSASVAQGGLASTLAAGGNLTLIATGDLNSLPATGAGNITVTGSDLKAGNNVLLDAQGDITLQAAQHASTTSTTNSSSSASVGVSVSLGAKTGVSANANLSRVSGFSEGTSVSQRNAQVVAGNLLTITSRQNTTLAGAVASAEKIQATVGGDLKLESLQDTATYKGQQKSAGVGVSVPLYGPGSASVSLNVSNAQVQGDYASVQQQSGLFAGDGGFNVTVTGNTSLVGGAITSSQAAIDAGKNNLSTGTLNFSDIANRDVFKSSGYSVGVTLGGGNKPGFSGGMGSTGGSQASITTSGISQGSITITGSGADLSGLDRSQLTPEQAGATSSALNRAWNGAQLMADTQAQVAITAAALPRVAQEIGNLAAAKTQPIDDANRYQALKDRQAQGTATPAELAWLSQMELAGYSPAKAEQVLADPKSQEDYANWKEGGAYRVAAHAALGALGGGIAGALGSATTAGAATALNDLQNVLELELLRIGASDAAALNTAQLVSGLAAGALGWTAGGSVGSLTGMSEDFNNRQLHKEELSLAAKLAAKSAGKFTETDIANLLRASGLRGGSKSGADESVLTGMLLDAAATQDAAQRKALIYDTFAQFRMGADGKTLVQVLPNMALVDPALIQFVVSNTGGASSPYVDLVRYLQSSPLETAKVGSDGLRRADFVANGKTFNLVIADCPAASCQTTDLIANFGLSSADQAALDAYRVAQQRQLAKDGAKLVLGLAVGAMAPPTLLGTAAAGAVIGGGGSVIDQTVDKGSVELTATVVPAIAGAVLAPATLVAANYVGEAIIAYGKTLDELVASKLVSQAQADAYLAAQKAARIENNFYRDSESYFSANWKDLKTQTDLLRSRVSDLVDANGKPLGNAAVAEIGVYGQGTASVQAHSRIGNDVDSNRDGFVSLPPEDKRILRPLQSPEDPISRREVDTEFKILEDFAQKHIDNQNVQGYINLFTERAPCASCSNVIEEQFAKLFPGVDVRIYHNNGQVTIYKAGVPSIVKMPAKNGNLWPTSPDLQSPPSKP